MRRIMFLTICAFFSESQMKVDSQVLQIGRSRTCSYLEKTFGVVIGSSWGSLSEEDKSKWKALNCDYQLADPKQTCENLQNMYGVRPFNTGEKLPYDKQMEWNKSNCNFLLLNRSLDTITAAGHPKEMYETFQAALQSLELEKKTTCSYFFCQILLVIEFGTNDKYKFSSAPQLREIYGKLFDEIVFTGSPWITEINGGSYSSGNEFQVLLCPGAERNNMAYHCLSEVMGRFPGRQGYLMVHFDVLVNWPALIDLPRDSIWVMGNEIVPNEKSKEFCNFHTVRDIYEQPYDLYKWSWFQKANPITGRGVGTPAIFDFLRHVPTYIQKYYHRICGKLCHTEYLFPGNQMGDIFYIPYRFVDDFRALSKIAFESNLYLEFAIPAILCGLNITENTQLIQLLGVPHRNRPSDWKIDYVFHQNYMTGEEGPNNIREMIDFVLSGERRNLPIYGLYYQQFRHITKLPSKNNASFLMLNFSGL